MKARLIFYPDVLQVHTDQELTAKSVETFHGMDCKCEDDSNRGELETKILGIRGVEPPMQITHYTFYIAKGKAFNWNDLVEPIVKAIILTLDPMNGLEQTEPAVEFYLANLNDTVYQRRYKALPIPPIYTPLKSSARPNPPPPPAPPSTPPQQ